MLKRMVGLVAMSLLLAAPVAPFIAIAAKAIAERMPLPRTE